MIYYLIYAGIALILAVIATRIFDLFYAVFIAPGRRKRILRDNAYHTVIGTQVTKYAGRDSSGHYHLQYKFEVDGKTYRRFIYVGNDNKTKRPFYYVRNPRAATNQLNQLGNYENTRTLYWILAGVLFVLISIIMSLGK